jgi:hypothetical protein
LSYFSFSAESALSASRPIKFKEDQNRLQKIDHVTLRGEDEALSKWGGGLLFLGRNMISNLFLNSFPPNNSERRGFAKRRLQNQGFFDSKKKKKTEKCCFTIFLVRLMKKIKTTTYLL